MATIISSIASSVITGILALIGVVITVSNGNKKTEDQINTRQAITDTKLEELTREVRLHNNFAQRVPILEEQIKNVNHRIDNLKKE